MGFPIVSLPSCRHGQGGLHGEEEIPDIPVVQQKRLNHHVLQMRIMSSTLPVCGRKIVSIPRTTLLLGSFARMAQLRSHATPRLQLRQQAIQFVFFLQRRQAVLHAVAGQLGFGLAYG